jgi:hypothetical protein
LILCGSTPFFIPRMTIQNFPFPASSAYRPQGISPG